jgi:hypothetical protein
MLYSARPSLLLTTLVVICTGSVLASRRHPRHYSSHHRPSFAWDNKRHRTKTTTIDDTSYWPSKPDDCLKPEGHLRPDSPTHYLHDDQSYDKRCLKTLAYLVEPEERAACRTQSDCHYARGYDDECLMRSVFYQRFDFNFEEMMRQELEWKKFVCHGKTLDQCGRGHSPWWRSRFPSSPDDCRIHERVDKRRQDTSDDNWVQWSIGPHGILYDNDCLSRFANRLGMENPRNCTRSSTYTTHEPREAPPSVELPKTLLSPTAPSGLQPRLALPTDIAEPDSLVATPSTTSIPTSTDIPIDRERKRDNIPQSPVHTVTQTADVLASSLPLASRAQGSVNDVDEWSCIWDVYITLPDIAPRMFDAALGDTIIDKTPLAVQWVAEGELRANECDDAA